MVIITSHAAERIADEILSSNEEILAIIIVEARNGDVLASKSSESFKKAFGVFQEGPKYGGSLAIAYLSIADEVREIVGEAKAIVTIFEKCKTMLLPIRSHEIVIGLVLQRSVNAEDYNIGNKIEGLLSSSSKEEEER
jgi:hypothetical protein